MPKFFKFCHNQAKRLDTQGHNQAGETPLEAFSPSLEKIWLFAPRMFQAGYMPGHTNTRLQSSYLRINYAKDDSSSFQFSMFAQLKFCTYQLYWDVYTCIEDA